MVFSISLLPREDRFYDLITENGELAYRSVQLLKQLVAETDNDKAFKLGHDIKLTKDKSKAVTNEIAEKLCQTFVTPFDREDIHTLAFGLYRIPKICEKLQERILAFGLKPSHNDFFKLTDNMAEVSELLRFLVLNLKKQRDSQTFHDKCALIHTIESNTDALLGQLLSELFAQETDVKQVILRKDIYDLMEKAVDSHRDMGNIVLEIVLKHA